MSNIAIGKKVNKIGKKAFFGCRNLKYFVIKTKKLKEESIGNKAFSKGYYMPKVSTNKTKKKSYIRIFVKKGMSSRAIFI